MRVVLSLPYAISIERHILVASSSVPKVYATKKKHFLRQNFQCTHYNDAIRTNIMEMCESATESSVGHI